MVIKQFSRMREDGGSFIGCTGWTYQTLRNPGNMHQLVNIPDEIDISMLKRLLGNQLADMEDPNGTAHCSTVLHTKSHKTVCDIPHCIDNKLVDGRIIHKVSNISINYIDMINTLTNVISKKIVMLNSTI